MEYNIRSAEPDDFDQLEKILKQNNMLDHPEIDGKAAMQRVYDRMGRYFLVAEIENSVIGCIRCCYDGSRAIINVFAVDPDYQRAGAGRHLLKALGSVLKEDGATSVAVTSSEAARSYYEAIGFKDPNVPLLVLFDIEDLV